LLKKVFKPVLLFSAFSILLFNCDYVPSSFGDFQKIVVYADTSLYAAVQTEVEQIFDQFVYTPHTERSFYLDVQPLNTLSTYQTRRNILFLGLLNAEDDVSKFINNALSEQVKQGIADDRIFEIFKPDLFASEQEVIFICGKDLTSLRENLVNRGQIIFDRLHDSYMDRLKNAMFLKGEQEFLEDYLTKTYGWKVRVQHDYQIVKEDEKGAYVWLRRLNPDRNLFVYRYAAAHFDRDDQWLFTLRDSLMTIFYDGDRVDPEDSYIQQVDFLGYQALKITGVWQNHKYLIGGPFSTYAFYDKDTKYIYIIDLSVTAPGELKKTYLDQLDIMAHTFAFVAKL
jgi:hypothetical protein